MAARVWTPFPSPRMTMTTLPCGWPMTVSSAAWAGSSTSPFSTSESKWGGGRGPGQHLQTSLGTLGFRRALQEGRRMQGPYPQKLLFLTTPSTGRSLRLSSGTEFSKKYPLIRASYESKGSRGLFILGTASHSVDYRKSAGGFIHGFRYTGEPS